MSKRKPTPKDTETEVLTKSARRCCICFGLSQDLGKKDGQIAHLDHDPSNSNFDNLAWLCLTHHNEYDSKTSQSKGLTIGEAKHYRDLLYRQVENVLRNRTPEPMFPPISLQIEPFPRPAERYASLKVYNEESQRLRCYAYLTKLVHVYTPDVRLDIRDKVNPSQARLSWHGGTPDGQKDIDSKRFATLNLAYHGGGGDVVFTFQDGNKQWHGQHFEVEVEVRSEMGNVQMAPVNWKGCIDLSNTIYSTINIQECTHVIAGEDKTE